jgi:uncharacterized protein YbjT (DUF2867 family)
MVVAIAGAHGKIGLRLSRLLTERGDRVLGLIRDPGQAGDLAVAGAEAVVRDLERDSAADVADGIAGAEAIVFSAGAGPGSGAERKLTLDRDGAILMIEAAKLAGASRYVIVSSIGADPSHEGNEVCDVYLRAKGEADEAVAPSGLDHTIVRPGHLTDAPGTGRVRIGDSVGRGEISRDDVAAVLAATLTEPATIGKTFELVAGDDEIEAALAKLVG